MDLRKMQNKLKDSIETILILILIVFFILSVCALFIAAIILVCEFPLFVKIFLVLVLSFFASKITFDALSIMNQEWREVYNYIKAARVLKHQVDVDGFEKEDYKK